MADGNGVCANENLANYNKRKSGTSCGLALAGHLLAREQLYRKGSWHPSEEQVEC